MRNLELLEHRCSCIDADTEGNYADQEKLVDPIESISVDGSGRTVNDILPHRKVDTNTGGIAYALTRHGRIFCVDEVSRLGEEDGTSLETNATNRSSHILWEVPLPSPTEEKENDIVSHWFHMTFLTELDALFLANHDGRLLTLDVTTREFDDIGTIEGVCYRNSGIQ